MIEFNLSAPGKMFLSGEPVIMYGKDAVAAAIDLRTTLKFVELINDPRNIIKIEFPDVNLSLNLPLELILNYFFINDFLLWIENHDQLLKHVQYFITINGLWSTHEQRYSLQIFLFLLLCIADEEDLDIKSFHVSLTTQLPINAGFGSSTSFAICLAACFLHWSRLQKGAHIDFDDEELEKIIFYVTICEEENIQSYKVIDPIVCARGQILKARYKILTNYDVTFLQMPKMTILLIDSGIRQNIYEQMMMQMAQIRQSNFNASNYILRVTDEISKRICKIFVDINNSLNNKNLQQFYDSYALLRLFIQSSQNLLHKSGLSHPKLDTICSIAKNYGLVGKLTGFYGYAYILLPLYCPKEHIIRLVIHLTLEGFNAKLISVGCNGLKFD